MTNVKTRFQRILDGINYLAVCNMCTEVFIDINPDKDKQALLIVPDGTRELESMTGKDGMFVGCPNCRTDGYLDDVRDDEHLQLLIKSNLAAKTQSRKYPKGKWLVRHSETKDAFNVVGTILGTKWKIARVPYVVIPNSPELTEREKEEAEATAILISIAPEMVEAMEEFCKRVEAGEVKSKKTYTKFKDILNRLK